MSNLLAVHPIAVPARNYWAALLLAPCICSSGLLLIASPTLAAESSTCRTITRDYHNRHYPTKGLLARTVLEDGAGRPY